MSKFTAINLFSGCGGMTEGIVNSGFKMVSAIEEDYTAAKCYRLNHPKTHLINDDISNVSTSEIKKDLKSGPLHFLSGCPPCQGFSSTRRLNRIKTVRDTRNSLINEYLRFVEELNPYTIMLENVPAMCSYYLFKNFINRLMSLGYNLDYDIVQLCNYEVPQRRRRFILVGSRLGKLTIAKPSQKKVFVKDFIMKIENINKSNDPWHKITAKHSGRIMELIKAIPKDGGSRKSLPANKQLKCHRKKNVGFNDIYGRLSWNGLSSTITGGCLNPSKGRFLHPEEDRVITPREAALLQTFSKDYKFPLSTPKAKIALMIGNALPPQFSLIQSLNIYEHLKDALKG